MALIYNLHVIFWAGCLGLLLSFFSSDFLYRQQQMQAEEGQRAQFRSRYEWIDTLPKAWRPHVLLEKETQLKE